MPSTESVYKSPIGELFSFFLFFLCIVTCRGGLVKMTIIGMTESEIGLTKRKERKTYKDMGLNEKWK